LHHADWQVPGPNSGAIINRECPELLVLKAAKVLEMTAERTAVYRTRHFMFSLSTDFAVVSNESSHFHYLILIKGASV
jgi:hypothetical protein